MASWLNHITKRAVSGRFEQADLVQAAWLRGQQQKLKLGNNVRQMCEKSKKERARG